MIRTEADELVAFVDRTWNMGFASDEFGHERWLSFMLGQEDSTVMMLVLQKLAGRQRQRITISDVRNALAREATTGTDSRAARQETREAFVRAIPPWVKTWLVARGNGDDRVLPEQKPGYDYLQLQYPQTRTYVWPEQEPMPDEERVKYATIAAQLGANLHTVFTKVVEGQ